MKPEPTPTERLSQLTGFADEVAEKVASVYQHLADADTMQLFRALHEGLGMLSVQQWMTASERSSSASPAQVYPWNHQIWTPITAPAYNPEMPGAVRRVSLPGTKRILGIKRSCTDADDWLEEGVDYVFDPEAEEVRFSDDTTTEEIVTGYTEVDQVDEEGNPVVEEVPTYQVGQRLDDFGFPRFDDAGAVEVNTAVTEWSDGDVVQQEDRSQPVTSTVTRYALSGGGYWIAEMRSESKAMWSVTGKGLGLTRAMRPRGFTAEHIPHWMRLFEWGVQMGAATVPISYALSGLSGAPFAYASGWIVAERVTGRYEVDYAVIAPTPEATEEELVWCEVPKACKHELKPVGTKVEQFEPLTLESPVSLSFDGEQSDATWSRPFSACHVDTSTLIVDPDPEASPFATGEACPAPKWNANVYEAFSRAGLTPDVVALRPWPEVDDAPWGEAYWIWQGHEQISRSGIGRPIRVRNLTTGYDEVLTIRRIYRNEVTVNQFIPEPSPGDVFVTHLLDEEPQSSVAIDIVINNPYSSGQSEALEYYLQEALPRGLKADVSLLQGTWEQLFCLWTAYDEVSWGDWAGESYGE